MQGDRRVALVTGAGAGLGAAIARRLARGGLQVYGTTRDSARALALGDEAAREGLPLAFLPLELSDDAAIDALAASFVRDGLDLLVQNAGFGMFGPAEELPLEAAARQLHVNFLAPMRLVRALLPTLRERRGQIIFVGSMAGRLALPFQADYSASKAAIAAMSDALRMELRPHGVRVTCVEPGDFATGFTSARKRYGRDGSPYAERAARCLSAVEKGERSGPSPELLAREVAAIAAMRTPPARVAVGRWAKTIYFAMRLLPDWAREAAVRRFIGA